MYEYKQKKHYQQIRKLHSFLGPSVIRLAISCVLIGIFFFLTETSFIFILQLFLVNLGLITDEQIFLPRWIPNTPLFSFFALILFGIIKTAANALKQYYTLKIQQVFIKEKREQLITTSLTVSKISIKDITTAFAELVNQSSQIVSGLAQVIITLISASLFLIYSIYLAPRETMIGVFLFFIFAHPVKKLSKSINHSGKELVKNYTSLNERLLLSLKNSFLIKIYNLSEQEKKKSQLDLENFFRNQLSYAKASSLLSSFPILSGVFIIALLAFIGTTYFHTDGVKLLAFFYLFIRFAQAMSEVYRGTSLLRFHSESFRKLYSWSIFISEDIPTNYSNIQINSNGGTISSIETKNLSFSYKATAQIFKNINLRVENGDILLIKGKSGSGKSTLLNILLGLYKPTQGDIYFNNTKGVPKNISNFIGYVGPEPYLLPKTVKENLLYGLNSGLVSVKDNNYSLCQALEQAQLKQLIQEMPKGLNTPLSDQIELSTGQKQRLALARALLRDPKILILDEATSNLDLKTEKEIINNLIAISDSKIIIAVSHRDSFDKIARKTVLL